MHEKPSDRCICSTRRHVRMHGSHAREEHVVTIAGSSVHAVSDAQDDNPLDLRRPGAGQVARDAPLQPEARVERSVLLCAANDSIRDAWQRCAPTHLKLPQDPPRCSATPRCAGCGYSWRSCVTVGSLRDQRGGWTGASGVLRRACGACCGNGCCSSPASCQCSLSARSIVLRQAGHAPGQRSTRSDRRPVELCWPLAPSAPCTCTVRYGRTRQLGVHVASRNGHVVSPGWAISTVPSHVAASSGAGAHVMDAAACSDAVCGLGSVRRETW